MFEASVDGALYDPERFGSYYRPYGVDAPLTTGAKPIAPEATTAPAPAPAPAAPVVEAAPVAPTTPVAETKEPEMATATATATETPSAQDILSAIRNRKQ